jgi:hypothetical protein
MIVSETTPAYQIWQPPALEGMAESAVASNGGLEAIGVSSGISAPTAWEGMIGGGGWHVLPALPSAYCSESYWSEDIAVAADGNDILTAVAPGIGGWNGAVTATVGEGTADDTGSDAFCIWSSQDNGATWVVTLTANLSIPDCLSSAGGMAAAFNGNDAVVVWDGGCTNAAYSETSGQVWVLTSVDDGSHWGAPIGLEVNESSSNGAQVVASGAGFLSNVEGTGYLIEPGNSTPIKSVGTMGSGTLVGSSSTGPYLYSGSTLQALDLPGRPSITIPSGNEYGQSVSLAAGTGGSLNLVGVYDQDYQVQGVECWSIHWPSIIQSCNAPLLYQDGLGGGGGGSQTTVVAGTTGWVLLEGNGPCFPGLGHGCAPFNLWILDSHPVGMISGELYTAGALAIAVAAGLLVLAVLHRFSHPREGRRGARSQHEQLAMQKVGFNPGLVRAGLPGGARYYRLALLAWAVCWTPVIIYVIATPSSSLITVISVIAEFAAIVGLVISSVLKHQARVMLTRVINDVLAYKQYVQRDARSQLNWALARFATAKLARIASWIIGGLSAIVLVIYVVGVGTDNSPNLTVLFFLAAFIVCRIVYHLEFGRGALGFQEVVTGGLPSSQARRARYSLLIGSLTLPFNPLTTMFLGMSIEGWSSSPYVLYALLGLIPTFIGITLVSWAWSRIEVPPSENALFEIGASYSSSLTG